MRTETEERLLKEIDKLIEAGAVIQLEDRHASSENRGKPGFAIIEGNRVIVYIAKTDTNAQMADYLVEAGTLIDKLTEIKIHELNHPDFRTAIQHRIYRSGKV